MARLNAKEVEVTLANGQVLHFLAAAGDSIVVNEIITQESHTPATNPDKIKYYTLVLRRVADNDR